MSRIETLIVDATTDAEQIDNWIRPAFHGANRDDLVLNNRDSLGSDDVPHLSLTQETPLDERDVWGEWGVHREIRWADHVGDPAGSVFTEMGVMTAGEYIVEFVRRNNIRVKLMLRYPCWMREANHETA
jgi:hypothetical protein